MRSSRRLVLCLTLALPPHAGQLLAADRPVRVEVPSERPDQNLIALTDKLEARIEDIRALPIAERVRAAAGLEGELQSLLRRVEGTRLENKALYLLASWRLEYRPDEQIEGPLQKILASKYLQYQNLAKLLLVRLRLRQGRVGEARQLANRLVDAIPQFAGILDDVVFHESAGQPAPDLEATNVQGGPDQVLQQRTEPWQVWYFCELTHPDQAWQVQRLLQELTHEVYQDKVRAIIVSFDHSSIQSLRGLHAMQAIDGATFDLLWVPPADRLALDAWKEAWRLPALPASLLIGPDRRIMTASPRLSDLGILVGRRVDAGLVGEIEEPHRNPGKGFGFRGRRR